MALNLEKRPMLDLQKDANKVIADLGLASLLAEVKAAIDDSGSMGTNRRTGQVQNLLDRVLAIATKFDNDGNFEAWAFDDGFRRAAVPASMANYRDYVDRQLPNLGGGTNYAPVMKDIVASVTGVGGVTPHQTQAKSGGFLGGLFGKKSEPTPAPQPGLVGPRMPVYVLFVTDGANYDRQEAERVIREASNLPIFWQFVGLGRPPGGFPFLEYLDDMPGRFLDNADFFVYDGKMSDEQLFRALLNEFPKWVEAARAKGIVA